MSSVTITNFKPYKKGSLAAFFSVTLPSGLIIHECRMFEKESRRWIGLPSRPFTGKDGSTAYAPILEFTSRQGSEHLREAVLRAVDGMKGEQTKTTAAPTAATRPPRAQIPMDDSDIPF
jgi:DNA-binding cell septation regulator SpoVG